MRSWDEIGEKLSVRFKRYLDGEDAFAGRWDFNKVLRALQKLERLEEKVRRARSAPTKRIDDGTKEQDDDK